MTKYKTPVERDNFVSIMNHLPAWDVTLLSVRITEDEYELEFDKPLDQDQLEHLKLTEV